jgi:hypothetical protein
MPKGYVYAKLDVTDHAPFETYRPLAAASILKIRDGWRRASLIPSPRRRNLRSDNCL